MSDTAWENFWQHELRCRCGSCSVGHAEMDPTLMDAIQWVRTESGIAMAVTSAARCNRHDDEITFYRTNGKRRTGHRAHTIQDDGFCHALDVRVWGESLEMLEQFLYKLGIITGRGYKQHGPHASRFVHWDNLPRTATRPRPWIWSYA